MSFVLKGHDCIYGAYPAPVIPIGLFNSESLVAVYPGRNEEVRLDSVEEDDSYETYSEKTLRQLRYFNYASDRLFAYKPDHLRFYSIRQEIPFFQGFLQDRAHREANPFLRLMLAKRVGERLQMEVEVEACFRKLQAVAPHAAPAWYQNERALLERMGEAMPGAALRAAYGAAKRILIVEDQRDIGDVLLERFTRAGHFVSVARDGIRAIEMVAQETPDLMILDLMLPGKSGMEVLQEIKDARATPDLRVMVFSALQDPVQIKRTEDLGAHMYVPKPATLFEVERAANTLLGPGDVRAFNFVQGV